MDCEGETRALVVVVGKKMVDTQTSQAREERTRRAGLWGGGCYRGKAMKSSTMAEACKMNERRRGYGVARVKEENK